MCSASVSNGDCNIFNPPSFVHVLVGNLPLQNGEKKNGENFIKDTESEELHPTFQVDGIKFNYAQYDKRRPGLFKVETTKHKMISLCSKMYCAAEDTDYCECCSCKNIECKCVKK